MKIEKNRIEIRVYGPSDDQEIGIFLPWDARSKDWVLAFKAILVHQEFAEETVRDMFFDESIHEYKEEPPLYTAPEYPKVEYPFGVQEYDPERYEY